MARFVVLLALVMFGVRTTMSILSNRRRRSELRRSLRLLREQEAQLEQHALFLEEMHVMREHTEAALQQNISEMNRLLDTMKSQERNQGD